MTTQAEVKRWSRPFLDWRDDLVLEGRLLLMLPVRHIMRGLYFGSSSQAKWPNVGWFMVPLFDAPSPSKGFRLSCDIPVGSSERPDFQKVMEERGRRAIQDFVAPVDTIQRLRDYAVVERQRYDGGFSALTLDRYPRDYAPVLAALGWIEEAGAMLRAAIETDEAYFTSMQDTGRALLAKRGNSTLGANKIAFAGYHLPILAEQRRLLRLLEADDRVAIAALLHEWEHANATKWGIAHLWEPTPFPLELSA